MSNEEHSTHAPRLPLFQVVPDVYRAMLEVERTATQGVDPTLAHLVKFRASQINHCAFCLDMHSRDARKAGESEERLYLLSGWEEAGDLYTEKERAALALTEAITVLTDGFVPDEVYQRAARHFSESELGYLISVIVMINNWNRMCVTSRALPGSH